MFFIDSFLSCSWSHAPQKTNSGLSFSSSLPPYEDDTGCRRGFCISRRKYTSSASFSSFFLYGQASRTGQMEQTVKLTSNQKAALNTTSSDSPRARQQVLRPADEQKTQEIKQKWPYSVCGLRQCDMESCLDLVANMLNLGTVGWPSFQEQTVCGGASAFLPATQYSGLHKQNEQILDPIFLFICLSVLFSLFLLVFTHLQLKDI